MIIIPNNQNINYKAKFEVNSYKYYKGYIKKSDENEGKGSVHEEPDHGKNETDEEKCPKG